MIVDIGAEPFFFDFGAGGVFRAIFVGEEWFGFLTTFLWNRRLHRFFGRYTGNLLHVRIGCRFLLRWFYFSIMDGYIFGVDISDRAEVIMDYK